MNVRVATDQWKRRGGSVPKQRLTVGRNDNCNKQLEPARLVVAVTEKTIRSLTINAITLGALIFLLKTLLILPNSRDDSFKH